MVGKCVPCSNRSVRPFHGLVITHQPTASGKQVTTLFHFLHSKVEPGCNGGSREPVARDGGCLQEPLVGRGELPRLQLDRSPQRLGNAIRQALRVLPKGPRSVCMRENSYFYPVLQGGLQKKRISFRARPQALREGRRKLGTRKASRQKFGRCVRGQESPASGIGIAT